MVLRDAGENGMCCTASVECHLDEEKYGLHSVDVGICEEGGEHHEQKSEERKYGNGSLAPNRRDIQHQEGCQYANALPKKWFWIR